ncbi:hypothetical protein SAMN05660909_00917 [Chitinophaga terrae (ex Kim and Jung 2007)]|uniref:Uncharacterized protein n=1 Tax=Chitinophaga terrae (ex Kim and Jung 2007) TaxID=408074 RepID=A0A1H3YQV9_9BACT|nr:hypothetical protein [Chitinophaga terrae (ex Kim and Jung 2007)]SEA13923.1 hypothetical protein SAMN05660909_00917 [Chitinophaga terrae (ex Kim and Jung 2007)]
MLLCLLHFSIPKKVKNHKSFTKNPHTSLPSSSLCIKKSIRAY